MSESLSRIKNIVGQKFIIIIDEWDVLIRDEAANKKVQEKYINFLRAMFKGTEPTKYIQLAYLTGIDRKAYKEQQYDILADEVRKNIDMDFVYKIIEEGV